MRLLLFCLLIILHSALLAQFTEGGHPNLVPNPSFEEFHGFPIGWYYKGTDFDDVVSYWTSATIASPDVYGPRVRVPSSWAEKGFGRQTPHTGQAMSGITVYGCGTGKSHCREYVQIQLKEPLVIGQTYQVEFWTSHLPNSLKINNLGAYFSDKRLNIKTEDILKYTPQIKSDNILNAEGGIWIKWGEKFVALSEADWMIIGNFYSDSQTLISTPSVTSLNFAYYYIDDVSVKKVEPIIKVPVKEDDLTKTSLEKGKVIRLKDIFFDSDKSLLLPRSFVELDKLVQVMRENPTLEIEVIGHTDNLGDVNYNLALSRRRAAQVVEYIVKNGIDARRMQSTGFGSSQPIAPNDVEDMRQLNRRVEFRIVKM